MRAIDAVIEHYNANVECHVDILDWGDGEKPLRICWRLLTFELRQKLFAIPNRGDIDVLMHMARAENGEPMFTLEDKPKLKVAADAAIITAIATKMLGADRVES